MHRVAFAAMLFVAIACQNPPSTAAPTGAATPSATAPPARSSSPSDPSPAARGLAPDAIALVVTDDLRMRTEPGVQDTSIKLAPLLDRGTVAIVLDGPVWASGLRWVRIHPIDPRGGLPEVGWVAIASGDGEQWVVEDPTPCPAPPIVLFEAHDPLRNLSCAGDQPQTFRARLGGYETGPCFELDVPWLIDPEWLDPCTASLFLVHPDDPLDGDAEPRSAQPAFAPGIEVGELPEDFYLPSRWPLVTVTGQYDHPDARACRVVATGDGEEPEPAKPDPHLVVLRCRATFVVTDLRPASS